MKVKIFYFKNKITVYFNSTYFSFRTIVIRFVSWIYIINKTSISSIEERRNVRDFFSIFLAVFA